MNRLGLSLILVTASLQLARPALAEPQGEALAQAKGCLGCHAVDRKLLGPAYRDVAAKYKSDPAAPARLAQKVMAGGGGVWGTAKMPSNPQLREAEARQLVAWVLSQK